MCATKILKKVSKICHSAKFPLKLFILHLVQTASLPETAIHKDTRPILPKHQVRMSWQPLMVQPIPESPTPQPTPHNHLRLRVLRPNSCHVIMTLLCREFIHISSASWPQSYTFFLKRLKKEEKRDEKTIFCDTPSSLNPLGISVSILCKSYLFVL